MLIIPPGHWQEVTSRRKLGRRERWFVASGATLVAALVIVVAISFTSVQKTSGHGCVDVSAATAIGGSELYRCGSEARALCTAPAGPGRENLAFRRALANACRQAGLPVPPVPRGS
jgi:hypothetical protein